MRFLSALLLFALLPVTAAAQDFSADRGPQYDPRSGVGSFDILVFVDGEAFINVQDTRIKAQTLSGTPVQNSGSNYSQPLPKAVFGEFFLDKIAGRGHVTLHEGPKSLNNFTAVVRINDDKPGRDLYHIRLRWSWNPADPSKPPFTGNGTSGGYNNRGDDRYNNGSYGNGSYGNNNSNNGRGNGNNNGNNGRGNSNDREGVVEFKGRVDGVTVLHIRGDQIRVENLSGLALREQSFRFSGPIPMMNLREISLVESFGRGRIELVEKPWDGNRYTAVVRISDSSNGSGQYSFKLAWRR
jgi:hypothetical protein